MAKVSNLRNFIDSQKIKNIIASGLSPSPERVREILAKSLNIAESLELQECADLINVQDEDLLEEIFDAAQKVKKKVYDNRIVTFAPLYVSNYCVNNCLYCGFRSHNSQIKRLRLNMSEIKKEAETLCGKIGHKRLILVTGEHPSTGADFIAEAIETVYSAEVKTRKGLSKIRRVNVNCAPMEIDDLKKIKAAGIGTYQVFQETYDEELYEKLHPKKTLKSDYLWRLYSMHRAFAAGIDDVAIGALFGLGDWRFEILGLLSHAKELEKTFNIGPHTISFPRLEKACGSSVSPYKISDKEFKKTVAILRLAVPYSGLIVTAREKPEVIRSVLPFCTQRDASTRIGIGSYSHSYDKQELEKQQFELGDIRTLSEVIGELADMGYITSFCTSGYRCQRTGDHIMKSLKTGHEAKFCKLNAILTFKEWLDDFAAESIRLKGEILIKKEFEEILSQSYRFSPEMKASLKAYYERIVSGERDICF